MKFTSQFRLDLPGSRNPPAYGFTAKSISGEFERLVVAFAAGSNPPLLPATFVFGALVLNGCGTASEVVSRGAGERCRQSKAATQSATKRPANKHFFKLFNDLWICQAVRDAALGRFNRERHPVVRTRASFARVVAADALRQANGLHLQPTTLVIRRPNRLLGGPLHNKTTIHHFLQAYPRPCLRVYNPTR
jgi:hypothetical protein